MALSLANAQDYKLKKHVFGSSAQTASNTEHVFKSTVGQSAAGIAQNTDFKLYSGFWSKPNTIKIITQTVKLAFGWNIISTYIIPDDASMEAIFFDIVDDIVLVKNNIGQIFYPEFEINDIGNWNLYEGYQVYSSAMVDLNITGVKAKASEHPISLNSGWNMVAYLRENPLNIESAFQTLTDDEALVIAKDNLGNIYYPEFGINDIGNMLAGQGYQVFLIKNSILLYPND